MVYKLEDDECGDIEPLFVVLVGHGLYHWAGGIVADGFVEPDVFQPFSCDVHILYFCPNATLL